MQFQLSAWFRFPRSVGNQIFQTLTGPAVLFGGRNHLSSDATRKSPFLFPTPSSPLVISPSLHYFLLLYQMHQRCRLFQISTKAMVPGSTTPHVISQTPAYFLSVILRLFWFLFLPSFPSLLQTRSHYLLCLEAQRLLDVITHGR